MLAAVLNAPPGDLPASPWWKHRDVLGEINGKKGYRPVAFAKIDETWTTLHFKKIASA
jgi:hypothetical protein